MEGMSERTYAAHSRLSRGAVQKARKNERLVLFADGSINARASDARRGAMTDPDQQLRSRGGFGALSGLRRCGAICPPVASWVLRNQAWFDREGCISAGD
jgi:hypothetical protein